MGKYVRKGQMKQGIFSFLDPLYSSSLYVHVET